MNKTMLTRKLPALLLALLGVQVALATGASAAPGLLTLLIPPANPISSAPAPAPGASPAAPAPGPGTQAAAPAAPTSQQVEQKLEALHYDVGPADGQVDDQTASAVMAFQKVNNLERTGKLTDAVSAQIMSTQGSPAPLTGDPAPNKVEIDLRRQVLFLYENGALSRIFAISSGTSKTPTPVGDFAITHQEKGWETSPLGRLYNSQYFHGGYAIHGSLSVPAEPASHGCVRLTMSAAEWFPQHVSPGTPVHVLAG
jgi:lipoprotein-anchoring transpeptidase ErfK/SrfK